MRVMEELITEFMKENKDIKVVYESMKGTEYYEVLKKRMLSGNGDDVFMVNHDTGRILKEKDLLVNLADSPVVSQYGDITKDQITDLSGRVYMLPMSVSMSGLYCNMDLLAENSITVPENLMQLQASCHAFFAKGITPLLVNKDYSHLTVLQWELVLRYLSGKEEMEETLSKSNRIRKN